PPASTTQIQYPGGAEMIKEAPRTVTPVAWMEAPQWLTVRQACRLSGWDEPSMLEIVRDGGVDVNTEGQIEKQSLYDFQQCLALVLHWDD
ncbi:MAG: hypothetical protein ACOC6F_00920, partial [bacterium]